MEEMLQAYPGNVSKMADVNHPIYVYKNAETKLQTYNISYNIYIYIYIILIVPLLFLCELICISMLPETA
jgi:hypothetical protein